MREPEPHDQPRPDRRSRVMLFVLLLLGLGLAGVIGYGIVDRPEPGTRTSYGADYRQAAPTTP